MKASKNAKGNPDSLIGLLIYISAPMIIFLFGLYLVFDYIHKDSTYIQTSAIISEKRYKTGTSPSFYCGVYSYDVQSVYYVEEDQICFPWRQVKNDGTAYVKYDQHNPSYILNTFHKTQLKTGLWFMLFTGLFILVVTTRVILERRK